MTLWCALALSARAHDPGLSTATLTVTDQRMEVALELARKDAEGLLPAGANGANLVSAAGFSAISPQLQARVAQGLQLYLTDQLLLPRQTTARLKGRDNVEMRLRFDRTNGARLRLVCTLLEQLPLGHRQFLSVHAAGGPVLAEAMLSRQNNALQVSLPALAGPAAPCPERHSVLEFLTLGIEHILTGYDHLLFLFALLVVCREVRSILAVITCFTIAHSMTLALATLDLLRVPGQIVEPLIAASIAYVGVENLLRGNAPKWRGLITFSFGLVHGLGFADALRELGINSGRFGIVLPLVGFNLGVELGQLSVAAAILPVLWRLRTKHWFVRQWVPVCSAAVAVVGSWWMLERIMHI
jgi:hydrogenase/urease accessory protein HupE